VRVSAPAPRLEPFTVRVAVATPASAVRVTEPSATEPLEKLTIPVTMALPVEGFTVAINVVEAVFRIVAGVAVSRVTVTTDGTVTVTTAAADVEPLKELLPA
jgi:hypothetical protein